MIICTVNTLAVNGNPLLRYDGYYISRRPGRVAEPLAAVARRAAKYREPLDTRRPVEDDALVPTRHRVWLAGYAVASKIYYAFLFVAIVWGLVLVLHPYHLENLAYLLGLTLVGGALVQPASSLYQVARNPLRRRELRKGRLATVAIARLVAAIVILAWPVNYYVRGPLVLMPADAARVYATVDGTLRTALPAGKQVARNETIATLANPEVEIELRASHRRTRTRPAAARESGKAPRAG